MNCTSMAHQENYKELIFPNRNIPFNGPIEAHSILVWLLIEYFVLPIHPPVAWTSFQPPCIAQSILLYPKQIWTFQGGKEATIL